MNSIVNHKFWNLQSDNSNDNLNKSPTLFFHFSNNKDNKIKSPDTIVTI